MLIVEHAVMVAYCSGRFACEDNCLQTLNPNLAKQWHPIKNGELTPRDVTISSNKRIWWICDKRHEWKTTIAERTSGKGCPYCSNQRVCDDNSLQALRPDLATQWHPSKNGEMSANDVTKGSNKKVWWLFEKGHEWKAKVSDRSRKGHGCPFCSGRRISDKNSLQSLYPELASQWHPTKNRDLSPGEVAASSKNKAWWQCVKGHEWEVVIGNRTYFSRGCPYCSDKRR